MRHFPELLFYCDIIFVLFFDVQIPSQNASLPAITYYLDRFENDGPIIRISLKYNIMHYICIYNSLNFIINAIQLSRYFNYVT